MIEDPGHVEWCRRLWESMNEGAVWGIPRTGLIFKKLGPEAKLVLITRVDPGSPEFRALQEEDLEGTREHFAEFGVEVVWNESD